MRIGRLKFTAIWAVGVSEFEHFSNKYLFSLSLRMPTRESGLGLEPLQLIREAGRQARRLEPYNEAVVRNTLRAIDSIFSEASAWAKVDEQSYSLFNDANQARFVGVKQLVERSKRILLAYQSARLDCITTITSSVASFPQKQRDYMTQAEVEFCTEYQDTIEEYGREFGGFINLRTGQSPPRELYIQVRVNRDCGVVQTEWGQLYLSANSFHFVRRSDVQNLIDRGFISHVT